MDRKHIALFPKNKKVAVRMPPSPTGYLHLGNVRTLLFNYLFAQKYDGKIIFRSEDTDRARSKREYEEVNMDDLEWLGLSWDEFHRQSERTDVYKTYIQKLLNNDTAYLSKEESRQNPGTTIEVVRLRNTNTEIIFEDLVHGEITFDTTELGDIVIARSLDDPLYHLTVVVDDYEMSITHVIRGEDHISNTPRQILIQEALGFERPQYAHLPIILGPDKAKLSKRHGAVALHQYREEGFLPEALTNYLALLGWNPGTDQEIFTLEELIQAFDLDGVQRGSATFDTEKLRWVNREHLSQTDDTFFTQYVFGRLFPIVEQKPQFSSERAKKLLPLIRERASTAKDVEEHARAGEYDFAFVAPEIEPDMLKWKTDNSPRDTLSRLRQCAEILSAIPDESAVEDIKEPLMRYAEEVGKGEVLWPLRVALTGKERSPDPFSIIHIIGTAEAYKRVRNACDTIIKHD